MGMLGSAFGRAAAGFGSAVASISNKYIDEEMAANKAKMLADLQHQNMVRADQYTNDPTRRGTLREQAALDSRSAAEATAAGQRAGVVAGQGDAAYQAAEELRASRDAERQGRAAVTKGMIEAPYLREKAAEDAKSKARTDLDLAKETAADKSGLEALRAIKLNDPEVAARIKASAASAAASYASAANSSAHAEQAREQTKGLAMVNKLKAEADVILNDDKIDDKTRKEKLAVIDERLIAMGGKQRAQRDPELDTETITEEKTNPDGSVTKTQRKQVRKPGHGGGRPDESDPLGIKAQMDAAREAKSKAAKPQGAPMINVPSQTLESIVGRDEAETLRNLAQSLRVMQSSLGQAGRSGGDVAGGAEAVTRASQALSQRLSGMSDQQRAAVVRLLGIQ